MSVSTIPHPYYAFVNLKIGKVNLSPVPPKHVQDFNYTRATNGGAAGSSISLTLFDESAIDLEYEIATGNREITFSYGIQGSSRVSPEYNGYISEYNLELTPAGAILTLEAVSAGLSEDKVGNGVMKTYPDPEFKYDSAEHKAAGYAGDGRISDIVRQLAEEEGYSISYVEQTVAPLADGAGNAKIYTRGGTSAAYFIRTVLQAEAVSEANNESGYTFMLDDSTNPPGIVFRPQNSVKIDTSVVKYEFAWGTGKDSEVISWSPQFSGIIAAVQGAGVVEANTVDASSNEMVSSSIDASSLPDRFVLGKRTFDASKFKKVAGSSSMTQNEITNYLRNMWCRSSCIAYNATLVVMGNPNVEPFELLSIVVYDKYGRPHHSSGTYQILSVSDSISGGSFETTIEMIRNANPVGERKVDGQYVAVADPVSLSTEQIKETALSLPGVNQTLTNMVAGGATGSAMTGQVTGTSDSAATVQGAANRKALKDDAKGIYAGSGKFTWNGKTYTVTNPIVKNAIRYLGQPYLYGGEGESLTTAAVDACKKAYGESMSEPTRPYADRGFKGYDCSGFVYCVLKDSGYSVTRQGVNAYWKDDAYGAIVYDGTAGKVVCDKTALKPGDLLFINYKSSFAHIGIYVGDNMYIHAPKPGDQVKITNYDKYCLCHGVKRV